MNKSDKIIFGLFLVAFFPFFLSLIGIGIGYFFLSERNMPYLFFAGLVTGIIFDIISVRRMLSVMFDIPFRTFAVFYIFCSIFLYGMFMGMPVPELVMGIAAGYYWGRRFIVKGTALPEREKMIRMVPRFTSLMMILICISSAFIALREKTIGEELQGMLKLGFVPGKGLIIGGIIIGGSALIIIQYFITRIVIVKTLKAGNG
jgi:hypothetical protein